MRRLLGVEQKNRKPLAQSGLTVFFTWGHGILTLRTWRNSASVAVSAMP